MTSRGNLNTLRKLFFWESTWFSTTSYKRLLFRDLVINTYITGLCYKLHIISSYFFIKSSFFGICTIECDLYLLEKSKLISFFSTKSNINDLKYFNFFFYKRVTLRKNHPFQIGKNTALLNNLMVPIFFQNICACSSILNIKTYFFTTFFTGSNASYSKLVSYFFFIKQNNFFSQFFYSLEQKKINLHSFLSSREIDATKYYPSLYRASNQYSMVSINLYYRIWLLVKTSILLDTFNKNLYLLSTFKVVSLTKIIYKQYIPFFFQQNSISFISVKSSHNLFSFILNYSKQNIALESYYVKGVFDWIAFKIENSLTNYSLNNFFFLPTIYDCRKPFIKSSKIVCEFIVFAFESGESMTTIFKKVRDWLLDEKKILSKYKYKSILDKNHILSLSKIPLKGIRIVCKGPAKRNRRKRRFFFHTWVNEDWITGKMPTQHLNSQIDYYQSVACRSAGTLGIKVWTLYQFISEKES